MVVNGEKVAKGRIDVIQCCLFSIDEAADAGRNESTPASDDFTVPFTFTGTIDRVTIELKGGPDAESLEAKQARSEGRA